VCRYSLPILQHIKISLYQISSLVFTFIQILSNSQHAT
jgi:hypothetical protein